jgi:hypothetical protein
MPAAAGNRRLSLGESAAKSDFARTTYRRLSLRESML